jgi:hypothetical protein
LSTRRRGAIRSLRTQLTRSPSPPPKNTPKKQAVRAEVRAAVAKRAESVVAQVSTSCVAPAGGQWSAALAAANATRHEAKSKQQQHQQEQKQEGVAL